MRNKLEWMFLYAISSVYHHHLLYLPDPTSLCLVGSRRTSFDEFRRVLTSFDEFRRVSTRSGLGGDLPYGHLRIFLIFHSRFSIFDFFIFDFPMFTVACTAWVIWWEVATQHESS